MNSAVPVIVHLPSTGGPTHTVFSLDIQREAKYLISAKEAGADDVDLNIQVYENYEELSEHTFVRAGFASESVPSESEFIQNKDKNKYSVETETRALFCRGVGRCERSTGPISDRRCL